ncbi:oligosaccharide flippase family protein [Natrarchaeobius sp. A-rgal3]|uniref:oligosaccharide flippase family protein n=1 Tax=Natrarchaeobius versutus TaxID=1679078 RepID=UPI00350F3D6C
MSRVSSDVLVSTLMQASLKVRGLILIPLLTLTLGVAEYGAYMQVLAVVSILANICLLGSNYGIVNYAHNTETPKRLFSSLFLLTTTLAVFVGALVAVNAELLARLTLRADRFAPLFLVGSAYIVVTVVFQLGRAHFQANRRVKLFSTFEAVDVYLSVGSIAFAIIVFDTGISGVLVVTLLSRIVSNILLYGIIVRSTGIARPTGTDVIGCLRFSIGALGNKLSQKLLDRTDRILVGYFLGAGAVGIYSAAYSVSYILLLYSRPLSVTFFPEFSQRWANDDHTTIQEYTASGLRYLAVLGLPSIAGLALIGPDVLEVLSTQDVAQLGGVVLVILAGAMLSRGVVEIYTQLFYATNNSRPPALIQGSAAIGNALLNVVMIPVWGIEGAAIASLLSFACSAIVLGVLFQPTLRTPLPWNKFWVTVVTTFVMFVVFLVIDLSWIATLTLAPIVYTAMLFTLGGVDRSDLETIVDTVQG